MERIHVSVRARPLSPEDATSSPWRISGNSIFTLNNNSSKFDFDRIFGENCPTLEVYHGRTKDIVAAAVRGFNGTVFAYGQTNSGKTHTMRGSPTERGVIPLSVYEIFDTIEKEVGREFLLRMSYMEIYNEEINDLLAPEHQKLQIHENLERGIYVAGLREEIVATPKQVLEFMDFGESHRHIGETNMNVYSSRSHTIFRMIIESRDKTEDQDAGSPCDAVRVSVLNLVDLAGSERAAKTGAEGVRLKEGSHINKSLMTLGTVIQKLSEGAESQGGHVPYRDSKLTRILQPALGGNSNTAIICNITLAQIHADETKSSLQFASRALRITNCARVNEILTDAALLKRQKKEIEELRAKLQGSHSEHLEDEILNLRNTLLQTELERERIALELEEEKKAQAERDRRLQEQAKKIENLSSMVLFSSRDENRDNMKREKRRDTWCPGKLSKEIVSEACSAIQVKTSMKTERSKRDMGPLLPFDELVEEADHGMESCKAEEDLRCNVTEDLKLPDPPALLHVTSRRKTSARNKTLTEENIDAREIQAEYEDLLVKFETQRIASELKINSLERKLAEVGSSSCTRQEDRTISSSESEALLVINQLQEQIKVLESEKSSSQQNLDSIMELAKEHNTSSREKFEELQEELLHANEVARIACGKLASVETSVIDEGDIDSMIKLSIEIDGIAMEIQNLNFFADSIFCLVDDAFQSLSSISGAFLDLKKFSSQTNLQQNLIITKYKKLHHCMKQKICALEDEKLLLLEDSDDLRKQIEDLKRDSHNSEMALMALKEQNESEKLEFLKQIQYLQKEISCSSSSTLAKERENLRKDLDKTKVKLKETEFKLRNAVQEKTKLESEKASAEREIKLLQGQKLLLERDINKRESIAGRQRDSIMVDSKRLKGQLAAEQSMQEEYKNLEVLAFEMEATIASLEDDVAAAHKDNEELISKNESLIVELESQTENVNSLTLELSKLQEEISELALKLEESKSCQEAMDASLAKLVEEKEELAMQLSESLLEIEEEKALWASKEKVCIEAIEEKSKLYNIKITSLSNEMLEVKNELESYKEKCRVLEEKLQCIEEDAECSLQKKDSEIGQLQNELGLTQSNIEILSLEHCEKVDKLQKELHSLAKEKEDLLIQLKELERTTNLESLKGQLLNMTFERDRLKVLSEEQQSHIVELERSYANKISVAEARADELGQRILSMEVEIRNEEQNIGKEKAKIRMRLKWAQAKLDAVRVRHTEALDEQKLMDQKFKEASGELKERFKEAYGKLKDRLAQSETEVLNLMKQLAASTNKAGCPHCQANMTS